MGKIYHKLVRDKIPQMIEQRNSKPYFYEATEDEAKRLLIKKLSEELAEFQTTPNEEELADILEVIDGMVAAFNLDIDKVLDLKVEKRNQRGGFEKRIVLQKVIEQNGNN